MKCHIIGNGSSRELFEGTDDFKICLNMYSYECDLLFAIDDLAENYLAKNNFFDTETVVSNVTNIQHEKIIDRVPQYRKGIPFTDIEDLNPKKASFNVGHAAYSWVRNKGYNEIHMWGFDVFFNKSLVSLSDAIFGHSYSYKIETKFEHKADKYLKIWHRMIDTPTYIHMPTGERIVEPTSDNKYLKGIYHGNG